MNFRAVIVAAVSALAVCGVSAPAAETKTEPLALGAVAPGFKLPGADDRDWSLSDFKDARALVVVFTCNHCPTAQAYEERLKKIAADYKAKGVALVAISPNDPKSLRLDELGYTDLSDSLEEMKLRARKEAFNFPYLYDGDHQEVSRAYGPTATPHAFLFDADRKLRFAGRIDDSERESAVKTRDLRNALDAVLAGKTPEVAQTRVFGCSVKWAGKQDQVKTFMDKLAKEAVTVEMVEAAGLKALRKGAGDKFRLVNFWATWCGPCIAEFPELVEIYRMYRHRDFEMVTVSTNFPDEKDEVLKFLKNQQASMKNLLWNSSDKNALMENFEPSWNGGVPYTVLLSPKGEILYKEDAGAIDSLVVKRAIVDALGRFKVK